MDVSHRIEADKLRTFILRLYEAIGTPHEIAVSVSRILVNADLKGHTSHGVLHIPIYMKSAEDGGIITDAVPEIMQETASIALVDARKGWGHYSAQWSMDLAMAKAKATGIGSVSLANLNHIGR